MKLTWNPKTYYAVVRALSAIPAAHLIQSMRVTGALPCPAPPWDAHRTYRVAAVAGVPQIEVEDAPGRWTIAEPLAYFRVQIQGLTEGTLRSMHRSIADALAADDAVPAGTEPTYGVRTFPDWRAARDLLESELGRRQLSYTPIVF